MNEVVLSLFPGIGLLDKAFEEQGFCVVRGPDLLWGGDVKRFHANPGMADVIIGGPPCQKHSTAASIRGTKAEDLIPEFVRICEEGKPLAIVMENVLGVLEHQSIPFEWNSVVLRDADCGGLTSRRRAFWLWPLSAIPPAPSDAKAHHSVMASTWKRGKSNSQYVTEKGFLPGDLPIEEYGRLQGCKALAKKLRCHPANMSRSHIIHMLGNGVPLAMGRFIAKRMRMWFDSNARWRGTDLRVSASPR